MQQSVTLHTREAQTALALAMVVPCGQVKFRPHVGLADRAAIPKRREKERDRAGPAL